jgi:cytochrome c biogenesis protein CcmG, thiol:disulfide interchange protein DsbE
MRWQYLAPLAVFVILLGFLGVGLKLDPRQVPSPLIDKPAPAFALPTLHDPAKTVTLADMRGKVWLLNVWASWCAPCREEHPHLVDFARRGVAPMVGLNYKDQRADAQAWLKRLGDPYVASLFDTKGTVGIDFGVYGVPETFVIDKQGVVRLKHIGPVTPQVLRDRIEPLLRQLNA